MTDWTEWETIDHRVVVSGRVVNTSNGPVAGMEISAECADSTGNPGSAPSAEKRSKAQQVCIKTARVKSRADGIYWFLDLPVGEYILRVRRDNSRVLQERKISLSCDDKGIIRRNTVNFAID